MKIGDLVFNLSINCKYCGHNFYSVKYIKPHVGLYCSSCKKWHKWLSKQEREKYGIIVPVELDYNKDYGPTIKQIVIDEFDEVPFV